MPVKSINKTRRTFFGLIQQVLTTQESNFVEKGINSPNIPQARPIENFWGDLSQKVYEKDWQAKTKDQLINRIKSKLKEFDLKDLQSHMRRVTAKLRNIADHGVFGPFKN